METGSNSNAFLKQAATADTSVAVSNRMKQQQAQQSETKDANAANLPPSEISSNKRKLSLFKEQEQDLPQIETEIEILHKKRKILYRDMARLTERFDLIKSNLFENKQKLLEEEEKLLQKDSHSLIKKRMDEIEAEKKRKEKVAQKRFESVKKGILNSHEFDILCLRNTHKQKKAELRRDLLTQIQTLCLLYIIQNKKMKVDDEVSHEELVWREDLFPSQITPLNVKEIDEDYEKIKALRQ